MNTIETDERTVYKKPDCLAVDLKKIINMNNVTNFLAIIN